MTTKYLSSKEVMQTLHIKNLCTLSQVIRRKKIPCMKIGRSLLFNEAKFESWLRQEEAKMEKDLRI